MVLISLAILESTLLLEVSEIKQPVEKSAEQLYIPSSRIRRSTVAPTLVKQVIDWYPPALKYAPALPTPN
jgi:hypothetical protein